MELRHDAVTLPAEIQLTPCSADEAERAMTLFMQRFSQEGADLRGELQSSLVGMRLILVFDYDSM